MSELSNDRSPANTILRLVAAGKVTSRAQAARVTGMARSTIGLHVDQMLRDEVLAELEESQGARGRPARELTVGRGAGYVVDVIFDRTNTCVAISDASAAVVDSRTIDILLNPDPKAVIGRVLDAAADLLSGHDLVLSDVRQVIASVPAPVDFHEGVTAHRSIMAGWEGIQIAKILSEHFGAPALMDNDANLMALGAATTVHRDELPLLHLQLSTGIGAGLITADAKIHRGADGSAGDIGHLRIDSRADARCQCGKVGCIGAYASLHAVMSQLGIETDSDTDPRAGRKALTQLVRKADPAALAALRDAAGHLGQLTAILVDMFNPRTIILGGGMIELSDDVLSTIRGVVYQEAMSIATRRLVISPSRLGNKAALVGAARLGADELLDMSPQVGQARYFAE
ncbi:ROK family protein [Arthrobacter sp. MMS18-M83]|uniref:ROK family protein n=1 Tax=Arthrobacter sp. MMS18-M83 TaxID=2996261 RepID=UPI00227B06C2|nr:ROK family protein [Arthrobacter sp. MMS18-M83]WAH97302.1 ROK family protein [Arthrobacter sp. MMS18-M83]